MGFKNILVPTDGSELSLGAVDRAIQFARETGAKIIGFHAVEDMHPMPGAYVNIAELKAQINFPERAAAVAREFLGKIEERAKAASVECRTLHEVTTKHPYEAIIDAANANGCDLIFMASHGRRGIQAVVMGSETVKVLTHSKIPVLVYR